MSLPLLMLAFAMAVLLPAGAVLFYEREEARRARRATQAADRSRRFHVPGRLGLWLDRANEQLRADTLEGEHHRKRHEASAVSLSALAERIRAALPPGVWVVAIALLGGGIWGLSSTSEVNVDAYGFLGTGYPAQLAWPLALLATLGFSLLGLAFWDLVGATSLLPFAQRLRPQMRRALAVSTVLMLGLAATQLPGLVRHRSEPIAAHVRELQQNLDVLEASDADPLVIGQVRRQLLAAEDQLESARFTDQRLAVAAAGTEAATSFAAVWLALLTASWTAAGLARRARRKAGELELAREREAAAMRLRLLDLVDHEGFTPDQVQDELDRRSRRLGGTPAVSAGPPPPPPDDEPADEPDDNDDEPPRGPAAGPRPGPQPGPGAGPGPDDEHEQPRNTSEWRVAL